MSTQAATVGAQGTPGSAAGVGLGFVVVGFGLDVVVFDVDVLGAGGVVEDGDGDAEVLGLDDVVGIALDVVADAAPPWAARLTPVVLPEPEHAVSTTIATRAAAPARIFFTATYPRFRLPRTLQRKRRPYPRSGWRGMVTILSDHGAMVLIRKYDPRWPREYERAREELSQVADGLFTAMEHIGSTSVPGLAAKPIIDIAAATPDLEKVSEATGTFARLGYQPQDFGAPGRLLFVRWRDGERSHHFHVFPEERWELCKERMVAAHLRKYPEAAKRYSDLKQTLAAEGLDGEAYTIAKTDLIQELSDAARAERGLPPEPVWET